MNSEELGKLFEKKEKWLWHYVLEMVKDEHLAEQICQDTYEAFIKYQKKTKSVFLTWIVYAC